MSTFPLQHTHASAVHNRLDECADVLRFRVLCVDVDTVAFEDPTPLICAHAAGEIVADALLLCAADGVAIRALVVLL